MPVKSYSFTPINQRALATPAPTVSTPAAKWSGLTSTARAFTASLTIGVASGAYYTFLPVGLLRPERVYDAGSPVPGDRNQMKRLLHDHYYQ
jgi:hypothetical protein